MDYINQITAHNNYVNAKAPKENMTVFSPNGSKMRAVQLRGYLTQLLEWFPNFESGALLMRDIDY